MTARELKAQALVRTITRTPFIKGDVMFHADQFQTFCETLCREQREMCATEIDQEAIYTNTILKRVLNAPMPEI